MYYKSNELHVMTIFSTTYVHTYIFRYSTMIYYDNIGDKGNITPKY